VLLGRGYRVVGLDSGVFRDVAFVPRAAAPHEQITKDIRDVEPADFKGVDAVMHLAALSNDPLGSLNPEATHAVNHRATVRVAEAARAAGVRRFLFSSSCSMYGVSSESFVTESASFNPQTPYAEAKVAAERDLRALANERFSPVYLRNATVFGISPRMRLDLVVQNLVAYGYLFDTITILSDGTPWRPLVHVRDVSEAFVLFLELPREVVHNQAFNIGHRENNLQIREIAGMVQQELPSTKIEIKNENPSDNRSYRVSFDRAYAAGYSPRYLVRDGIREIHEVYRRVKFSPEDFQSDAYITLKRYQRLQNEGRIDSDLRLAAAPRGA
jgi:nucleoside-diphosphate-sugar epimerase